MNEYYLYITRIENMRNYFNIMHTKNKLMKNKKNKIWKELLVASNAPKVRDTEFCYVDY